MDLNTSSLSADNLELAVSQFYHADTSVQAQAHEWLILASSGSWDIVWELLHPQRSMEAQFFAATTVHTQLKKNWVPDSAETANFVKNKLLETIQRYASGPKVVLNRLCLSLACFVLRTIPTAFPCDLSELFTSFLSQSLQSTWILLEVLKDLPEEVHTLQLAKTSSLAVVLNFEKNLPSVIALLRSILDQNLPVSEYSELKLQCIRCASSWLQYGIPLNDSAFLLDHLLPMLLNPQSNEEVQVAVEALNQMATHPCAHQHPNSILKLMERLLPLSECVIKQQQSLLSTSFDPDKLNFVSSVFGLFVAISETHSRLILNSLLVPETHQLVLTYIHTLLACSNAPGQYPTQEQYSQLPFSFWFILQDDLTSEEDHFYALQDILTPIYKSLSQILLTKAMYGTDGFAEWSAEDKEIFRCYRQDVQDTLMYCYAVIHESLLEILLSLLEHTLNEFRNNPTDTRISQTLETCLFGFLSIAENVNISEEKYLPQFFATLKNIPFQLVSILTATIDAIGAYADWLNEHNDVLGYVLPLLLDIGLSTPETVASTSMALKDITWPASSSLTPYAEHILLAIQNALNKGNIKCKECVRLMSSVGKALSVLPFETAVKYMDALLSPLIIQLQSIVEQPVSPQAKSGLLQRLNMLSTVFTSLQSNPTLIDDPHQPVFLILEKAVPVLKLITEKWTSDIDVIEAVMDCLKSSVGVMKDGRNTIVQAMLKILVDAYRARPNVPGLQLATLFLIAFHQQQKELMCCLFSEICSTSLLLIENCSPDDSVSYQPDIIEAFYTLCAQVLKKNLSFYLLTDGIDLQKLFKCAVAALRFPEVRTVRSASSFLINLISVSRESPTLLNVVQCQGEETVIKVLMLIGGSVPRSSIEHLSDVLMAFNKKYCDNFSRWLQLSLSQDSFPSPYVTSANKQHFIKSLLKERANRRKSQEVVREFALICRGIIATDHGAQIPS